MFTRFTALAAIVLSLTACHDLKSTLIFPGISHDNIQWTKAQLSKPMALQHVYRSEYSSGHIVRLASKEQPHYHDQHDLNVTLLEGKSLIHFQDRDVLMQAGDVVFIPKGTYHWAENLDKNASVVFAVYSPAFAGKDKRLAISE